MVYHAEQSTSVVQGFLLCRDAVPYSMRRGSVRSNDHPQSKSCPLILRAVLAQPELPHVLDRVTVLCISVADECADAYGLVRHVERLGRQPRQRWRQRQILYDIARVFFLCE